MEGPRHILDDVPVDKTFWINGGPIVRNIYELVDALEHISFSSFAHHANPNKNDFSNWIEDTLGSKQIADSIRHKNREDTIKVLKNHIAKLEEKIEQDKVDSVLTVKTSQSEEMADKAAALGYVEPVKLVEQEAKEETVKNGTGSFSERLKVMKESLKNNMELFLLGLIAGIILGRFILGSG